MTDWRQSIGSRGFIPVSFLRKLVLAISPSILQSPLRAFFRKYLLERYLRENPQPLLGVAQQSPSALLETARAMESLLHMKEDTKIQISDLLHGRSQNLYGAPKQCELLYTFALEFLEKIFSTIQDENLKSSLYDLLLSHVRQNAELAFEGVNREREQSERRRAALQRYIEHVCGRGAIRLELGTWSTFPPERVHEIMEADGIGDFICLDYSKEFRPDVVADCAALPFKDKTIDIVQSNSLLEHIKLPFKTITESYRVLAPGGVMRITVPFHFTLHGCPGDYLRYTPQYLEERSKEAGFEQVECFSEEFGGLYYTLHQLSKATIAQTGFEGAQTFQILHHNVMALLFLLSPLDQYFEGGARNFFHSVECIAYKAGNPISRPHKKDTRLFIDKHLDMLCCPRTKRPLQRDGDYLRVIGKPICYRIEEEIPNFTKEIRD